MNMSGDLIAEKEYKETIDSGIKTWKWLKSLFGGYKISDDDFIKTFLDEAKGKADEIDKGIENIDNETIKDSFVEDFEATYKETQNLAKANNEKSEANQEMQESQVSYFSTKSQYIEYDKQQGTLQSKKDFMQEFRQYAKKEMTADEMRVLIALSHSKDSKLTPEHKIFIKDCLNLAQKHENPHLRFLSEGHLAIIRISNNQKIGTHSIKEFLHLANNPKDKLDSTLIKNCKEFCVKNIMESNKNLPQATIAKLKALINPTLAKTMQIGANIKKEMGM